MASRNARGALPPIQPDKRVAHLLDEADAPPRSAALGTARKPGSVLASSTQIGGAGAATSEITMDMWMAPGGRLRIGNDGVPLKFKLVKSRTATARRLPPVQKHNAKSNDVGAAYGAASGPRSLEASAADPSHRYAGIGRDDGAGFGSSDEETADAGGRGTGRVGADTSAAQAAGQDALLAHHLSLVVALVGPEVALELELGDLFRARMEPSKFTGLYLSSGTLSEPGTPAALEEADKRGMGFLRIDESKLRLHYFDDAEAETVDVSNVVGAEGVSPLYAGGAWTWEPVVVKAADPDADLYDVEFTHTGIGRTKTVHRLDLCFAVEDRVAFAARVATALRLRETTKAGIRFQYLIDTVRMPQELAPIQDGVLAAIYSGAVAFRGRWSYAAIQQVLAAAQALEPQPEEDAAQAAKAAAKAGGSKGRTSRAAKGGAEGKGKRSDEDDSSDDEGAAAAASASAAAAKAAVPINPATGLPVNASAADLLAKAASEPAMSALFGEVVFEYEYAVKASVLFELLKRAEAAAASATSVGDTLTADSQLAATAGLKPSRELEDFTKHLASKYHKLKLPQPPARKAVPLMGKLPVDARKGSYAQAQTAIRAAQHVKHPRTIRVLRTLVSMWLNDYGLQTFLADDLTSLATPLPCSVKDYIRLQSTHLNALADKLTNVWPRDVANTVVDGLPGSEFNVYEQEQAAYEGSLLPRMLHRLELTMTDQVRTLMLRTCESLRSLLSRFLPDAVWDKPAADGITRSYKQPLFEVHLVIRRNTAAAEEEEKKAEDAAAATAGAPAAAAEDGADASAPVSDAFLVSLSPSRREVQRAVLGTLTAATAAARNLRGIEKRVMTLLPNKGDSAILLPVGTGNPLCADVDAAVADTKAWIKNAFATSLLAAPMSLAAKFQRIAWLAEAEAPAVVTRTVAAAEAAVIAKAKAAAEAKLKEAAEAAAKAKEEAAKGGKAAKKEEAPPPPPEPVKLDLVDRPLDMEVLFTEVARYHEAANYIRFAASDFEDLGLLRVHTAALKTSLARRAEEVRDALLARIIAESKREAEAMHERYAELVERISQRPRNEAELLAVKAFIKDSEGVSEALDTMTAAIHARMARCGTVSYAVPAEEFRLFWSLKEWPICLAAAVRDSLEALDQDKARMIKALEDAKVAFEKEIDSLEVKVNNFKDVQGGLDELLKIVARANDIDGELKAAQEKAEDFNMREKAFGFPATQYTMLHTIGGDFEPFYKLWTSLSDFVAKKELWAASTILDLEAGDIERDVTEWWSMSYKLMKNLGDAYPGANNAAKMLRSLTDEYRKNVPLIRCLASRALEHRHWSAISDRIGHKMNPHEEDVTLQECLDSGMVSKIEEIEEIAVMAEKEHNLKKALDAMKREWDSMAFDVHAYKSTGTYVVRGTDEINQLLDDQIVKTQTMMGSPYIKPNKDECERWEKQLSTVQQVLEEWLLVQRTWLYLEPIFSSEDIMRAMPQEGRRFASVDKLFRKTMGDTHDEPKVLIAAGKENMLSKMREANKLLDQIQKGLNDYLELKRLAFPRFFFLSNDELLEILSQTKDPRAAQPHLGKCFEGIAKIAFRGESTGNEDDLVITQMISAESENVPLLVTVDPNGPKAKGNVEVWFTELQRSMRLTVKDVCKKALLAYSTTPRDKWVLQWPGQIVLNISQLFWTKEVEEALNSKGAAGLAEYETVLNNQLQDIVNLVRGKLSKMERTTLGALTVIDVHARDVISAMVQKGVASGSEFDWMSQLRYYWEEKPDDYNRYGDDPFNLVVKIINAAQIYGYEYLGNSSRLVITPLTDRCYRTLMSAVYLMYGGAPAGPAGTGKTETTKDLAKAVAIQCVVFNCSDGLDYLAMAKFFKGLASAGAWACFDEFNRIELEVLSVVAQQILTIQKAKRGRVAKFNFEGTTLVLNPDANAFITMNPGYAGRSELPDNLKALFRPVAMMVPDYALISEIKLYSFGFADARNMARKLTQVLRLSSEQLSSQKHYDYGMRAVFSILVRAGNLRQALGNDPAWSEDKIVLSAINDVNIPKFTTNDLPLFRGITSDLFPGVVLPTPDYQLLMNAIKNACRQMNLQAKDEFIKSVIQLYETVAVRHGLMLVGETGSGKTAVLRTLALAMSSVAGQGDMLEVEVNTMNPKSITQGQLYGNFDENTHEWTDGVLAVTYRNCTRKPGHIRQWVMFDGPVDAVWIENMNTVLDDNKKLCLNSGEIIKMTPVMTMMFETDNLEQASPATVSRCGMVYMEPKRLGWRPVVQSWLTTLPRALADNKAVIDQISAMFEWLVPPLLAFCANHIKQLTPVTDLHLVASLVRMYDSLLEKPFGRRVQTGERGLDGVVATSAEDEKAEADERSKNAEFPKPPEIPKILEGLFLMAVVWTIGAVTDSKGRVAFNEYFRKLLNGTAVEDPRYKDFALKAPHYDAIYLAGGMASRAADGDVRDHDFDHEKPHAEGGEEQPHLQTDEEKQKARRNSMAGTDTASRFHMKAVREGELRVANITFPEDDTVYDWCFNVAAGKGAWKGWTAGVPPYKVPEGAEYTSIIVPTVDTIRSAWLLDLFITHHQHVLTVGDTGTGKSVTLMDKLMNGLNPEVWLPLFLNFSAQTSANQTQDIIDGKMARRRKGVFGPPLGQRFIIFVDDLNMPAKEKYGAQPPIEILRQWMDHRGWFDRRDKDLAFMELTDIQFVSAMGPPGGGRTRITQRYVRHFNVLGFVPFDNVSLQKVFGTIVNWSTTPYGTPVKSVAGTVVGATVDVYNCISLEMLPTPAKSHYTFNLRDLSKVFQGMNQASPAKITEGNQYIRLWAHELQRVFYDRLTTESDRKWFMSTLADKVKEHFKKDWVRDIRGAHDQLIYGNFVDQKTNAYEEIANRDALRSAMATYLEDYNAMSSSPLNLVLFMYAIEHVARISRVINQPGGNALLVGVGGSGRKSLCTLASFMAGYKVFQVEITKAYGMNEWRDDLKKVLMMAGREGKSTVFLFSDTQIVKESFVEDINNILNNGEVPNLFAPDERAAIIGDVQAPAKKEGKVLNSNTDAYAYFIGRVKRNLHLVLCFSPIGDAFRTRLRMFPSLVNCCTIDWFTPWPEEGLRTVAHHFLAEVELPGHSEVKEGVIDVCVDMQTRVTDLSTRYSSELRRHYYVTPTSYLELLNTFKALIGTKRKEILTAKSRYENGLEKIISTEGQVEGMKHELVALQPKLKVASEETDAMIKNIEVVKTEANAKAAVVAVEAKACGEQAAAANAIKTECESDLAEAIPILEGALKAVEKLSKNDITEVKAMGSPPEGVKLTMETLCVLLKVTPPMIKNPAGSGPKVPDYWGAAKSELLSDPKLIDRLKTYDVNNIPESVILKITPYIAKPEFAVDIVSRGSKAAGGLASWVHALVKYDKVARVVAPKRAALEKANGELAAAQALLAGKEAELAELNAKLAKLQEELDGAIATKNKLTKDVQDCANRLDRAQRLIGGLGGEKVRWTQTAANLQNMYENIVGDVLLSAGMIAYLGAFVIAYREECITQWSSILKTKKIPCAAQFKLAACLGDQVQIRSWTINKLPNDFFSIDNAIMMFNSGRWPLCIDPQRQANKWIRNTEAARGIKVVKQSQNTFVRTIESAIQFGTPVLLENVPETLDPVLEPLLARQIIKVGGVPTIRIGDSTVEYDPNFRLYITTVLPNPHYAPETCVKVNLLNFMATQEGLQDQMLGIVVKTERPDLEEQREKLILEDAENKRQLKELEDKILALLASSTGNILDDEVLVTTLGESKVTSNAIMKQVEVAERTQAKINTARQGYTGVAKRASMLFFCIADLAAVDPMYQYSLEWYIKLFLLAIEKAPKPEPPATSTQAALAANLEKRLVALKDTFTYVLYENVCRSLFEKDKLLFSLLLATKIMVGDGRMDAAELKFLLQGSLSMALRRPNPVTAKGGSWLADKSWADIMDLAVLPAFKDFDTKFEAHLKQWEGVYTSPDPTAELTKVMGETGFTPFHRLMVLRCLRPDKVVPAIQQFITVEMGRQFIDPPTFNLQKCYEDSDATTPLVFVLSTGADPMSELMKLADKLGKGKKLVSVSLGQGQGPIAEKYIQEAVDTGAWVCLQNCHLAESWLPTLERMVEEIKPESTNEEFRLWLTAMPSPKFPVAILQNGVKMTLEPPKGMRANLQGSYLSFDHDWIETSAKPAFFKKLVFGLCFFHALVLERRKFGPLGWNIRYDFADSDLRISLDQLKIFVDDPSFPKVPFEALAYLTGECNYGGRVTDDMDRRCLMNMLSDIYNDAVIAEDKHKLTPSGIYYIPADGDSAAYIDYIRTLPFSEAPEVFGLNENADITTAIQETGALLATALSLQPRGGAGGGGGGKSADETLLELTHDIQAKVPEPYDIEKVEVLYPVAWEESMNTVLTQECMRFNVLVSTVKHSLKEIGLAIKGLTVMSGELEALGIAMVQGRVPDMWKAVAYPSTKPLGSWVNDLVERLKFLQDWIDHGKPNVYWISGFFFTQSFLTGTRQNFARKYAIPIDLISYDFGVLRPQQCVDADNKAAEDGCFVKGLFLQSACWDSHTGHLSDAKPRELFSALPYLHLLPAKTADIDPKAHRYHCPCYKTPERAGVLSTTGHSTNFVMTILLPMPANKSQKYYVKLATALFTQSPTD